VVGLGDGGVDRVPVERLAVHEEAHEAADVAVAIENEPAKAGMLDLDGFDARPHAVGIDFDETKTARRSPVARRHLYFRQLLFLQLRAAVDVRY
jgi:hypothetical protein